MGDASGSELNDRERMVLSAIVESHIDSREPVGSRTLAERMRAGVSPATVRNVMGALSERGFIEKPHTSAGRVPTDRGLRFYVDTLLQLEAPPDEARAEIEARLREAGGFDEAVGEAGRVLSRLARQACVIRAPRKEAVRLKHIELVRLREDAVLAILVTEEGLVQNRLIELPAQLLSRLPRDVLHPDNLARLSRTLCEKVEGRSLDEVRAVLSAEVDAEREEMDRFARDLANRALLPEDATTAHDLLRLAGERHLLEGADARSLERMRELYTVLDEKARLIEILDTASEAPGIRIFIGEESGYRELADMSLVAASYGRGEAIFGSVGVLGPTHMDYGRVVPLVAFTAEAVSKMLVPSPGGS